MAVYLGCFAWLAVAGTERFLLCLLVLARILVHSWHGRHRARFHGRVVREYSPVTLETLRPHWAVAITHIGAVGLAVGLAVALLAALALLLKPTTARNGGT